MTLHQHRHLFTTFLTGIIFALSLTTATIVYADYGAVLDVKGTFVDSSTGVAFELDFWAKESIDNDVGKVELYLLGKVKQCALGEGCKCTNWQGCKAIRACSTRGSKTVGFEDRVLENVLCEYPRRQAVSISGCSARFEVHGYVHSNLPYTAYSGSTTIDINIKKKTGDDSLVVFTFYTPKKAIKVQGTLDGVIEMSTCAID